MFKQGSKYLPQFERSTWQVLLIGLLTRLLVMPFAAHSDLMQTYWTAHLVAYHHNPTSGPQTLLRLFHAAYLWLLTPFLPPMDSLWIHHSDNLLSSPFFSQQVTSVQGWFDFISHPQVFRTLFLLKLPYLFFDLACAFLLYRLNSDKAKSRLMFKFYWLNPILFFVTYIFGRHEVITLFFIILSLYWIKQEKHGRGLLVLGLAIAIRYYAIFLLPFFVFSLYPTWKKRSFGLIVGLIPWLVANLVGWLLAGSTEAMGLANLQHISYLLAMKFQIAAWDNLYIFPLAYFLLLLHRFYNREVGLRSMQQYSLIVLLLLFATAYTGQSPQYWTWLIPFLTIAVAEDHHLLPLHAVQIASLVVYSFIGGRSMAGYLFAPIAPDFFWSLPSPVEVFNPFFPHEVVIGLARSALTAITLWMAYLVLLRMKSSFSAPEVSTRG